MIATKNCVTGKTNCNKPIDVPDRRFAESENKANGTIETTPQLKSSSVRHNSNSTGIAILKSEQNKIKLYRTASTVDSSSNPLKTFNVVIFFRHE
ncbi:hypothetical protein D3C79_877920 [compost metagenome]